MKRVSLADVARVAGVGKATASRALSGDAHVEASTRARILETASELGYRPSQAARTLRTGRSGAIALAFGEVFPGAAVEGVFRECQSRGYRVVLEAPEDATQRGARSAVDGRIVVDPTGRVVSGDTLTVVIDEKRSDHDAVMVGTDIEAAVATAVRRLRHEGARTCAVVTVGPAPAIDALPASTLAVAALGSPDMDNSVGTDAGGLVLSRDLPDDVEGVAVIGSDALRLVPPGMPVVLIDLAGLGGSPNGVGSGVDTVARPLMDLGTIAARLVLDALISGQRPAPRTLCEPAVHWA